ERGDVTPRDSCSSLPEPWARRPQALPRAWRSADTTGLSLRSGPAVDGNADAGAAPGISAHCALSVRGAGPVPCVESLLWRSLSDTHVALPEASLRAPVASLRFELAHQPGRMCGETASGPPSRKAAPSRAEEHTEPGRCVPFVLLQLPVHPDTSPYKPVLSGQALKRAYGKA